MDHIHARGSKGLRQKRSWQIRKKGLWRGGASAKLGIEIMIDGSSLMSTEIDPDLIQRHGQKALRGGLDGILV